MTVLQLSFGVTLAVSPHVVARHIEIVVVTTTCNSTLRNVEMSPSPDVDSAKRKLVFAHFCLLFFRSQDNYAKILTVKGEDPFSWTSSVSGIEKCIFLIQSRHE